MNKQTKYTLIAGIAAVFVALLAVAYYKRRAIFDVYKQTTMKTYFTIDELLRSDTAKAKGIVNQPTEAHRQNLEVLIQYLNKVREQYGKPIIISSGYRSEALNKAIGGAANSQHSKAEAADIVPATGGNLAEIFYSIIEVGKFDQLIWEVNAKGSRWVHVSHKASGNRGEILEYNPKTKEYVNIQNSYKAIVKI